MGKEHVVYLVELEQKDPKLANVYKVGISSNFKQRFKGLKHYRVLPIRFISCLSRAQALYIEGHILHDTKQYSCFGHHWMSGRTELRSKRALPLIEKMMDKYEKEIQQYGQ